FAAQFIVRLTVLSMTRRMAQPHGSKPGPADDPAQGLTLISLSGIWFGAQLWARPLSPVNRRNGGAPRPLCWHSGLGAPPLFRPASLALRRGLGAASLFRTGLRRRVEGLGVECGATAGGGKRGTRVGEGTAARSRGREAPHQRRAGAGVENTARLQG